MVCDKSVADPKKNVAHVKFPVRREQEPDRAHKPALARLLMSLSVCKVPIVKELEQ